MTTLFLSHASEDKNDLVRPLAEKLRDDFEVWYDEYELVLGDSLLQKITEGLHKCDYGVVVLSRPFFAKKWPRAELDGLFALETNERKVILPIWKDVTEEDVKAFSPILAGRLGVPSADGIERIILEIKRAVGLTQRVRDLSQSRWKEKFALLDEDVAHRKAVAARSGTVEGVRQVTEIGRKIIAAGRDRAEELKRTLTTIGLHLPERSQGLDSFSIRGPGLICLHMSFSAPVTNSVDHISLRVGFFRDKDVFDERDFEQIEVLELAPAFDREFKVSWKDVTHTFSNGEAVLDFAFDRFADLLENQLKRKS